MLYIGVYFIYPLCIGGLCPRCPGGAWQGFIPTPSYCSNKSTQPDCCPADTGIAPFPRGCIFGRGIAQSPFQPCLGTLAAMWALTQAGAMLGGRSGLDNWDSGYNMLQIWSRWIPWSLHEGDWGIDSKEGFCDLSEPGNCPEQHFVLESLWSGH